MLQFFLTKHQPFNMARKSYPKMDYIRRRYNIEFERLLKYYQDRNKFVNNSHILVRAIGDMLPEATRDDIGYFKYLDSGLEFINKHYNFTSNTSVGKLHEDLFYGSNSYVIINSVRTNVNLFFLKYNWLKLNPIRVIYNTSSDLDFYINDKSKIPDKTNLMSIEIDLVLTCMMYKYWANRQLMEDKSTKISRFVANILLPRLMMANLDIVMFNRFKNIFYYDKNPDFRIDHPFHVVDLSKGVDDNLREAIKYIHNSNFSLDQLLYNIPTLLHDNMKDVLWFNNTFPTRQSLWSLWVSRIEYMVFLLDLLGERGMSKNEQIINKIPFEIKRLENGSTEIRNKLPPVLITEFYNNIEKLKDKLGKR